MTETARASDRGCSVYRAVPASSGAVNIRRLRIYPTSQDDCHVLHPQEVNLAAIQAAAARIQGVVRRTPVVHSPSLSELTGMEIHCKYEHLQRTGSFKERGARNALELLDREQMRRGVVAASAGNHGLGLAYHGQLLGIPVTVVMPRFAPLTKVGKCRALGAEVVLSGDNIAEARERADELARTEGLAYINGFDDPAIIAGQGTIGIELAEQIPEADAVVVPIGGGGLIAGVALALRSLSPGTRVYGVEPTRGASYTAALQAGEPVEFRLTPSLADGLAVPKVGTNAFRISQGLVERVALVRDSDIALALLRFMELEKIVLEGAGAASLAACLSGGFPELQGKKVALLLCGGNIDTPTLGRLLERALARDGRLNRFTASISDRPGGLAHFASLIAREGASVVEIAHDRAFASDDINTVRVHCVVETRDAAHAAELFAALSAEGFPPEQHGAGRT